MPRLTLQLPKPRWPPWDHRDRRIAYHMHGIRFKLVDLALQCNRKAFQHLSTFICIQLASHRLQSRLQRAAITAKIWKPHKIAILTPIVMKLVSFYRFSWSKIMTVAFKISYNHPLTIYNGCGCGGHYVKTKKCTFFFLYRIWCLFISIHGQWLRTSYLKSFTVLPLLYWW